MMFFLVPRAGFEPAYLSVLAPKASASANFATSALAYSYSYITPLSLLKQPRSIKSGAVFFFVIETITA